VFHGFFCQLCHGYIIHQTVTTTIQSGWGVSSVG